MTSIPTPAPVAREAVTQPADCEVCSRLLNLWLSGEWVCPRCGGPDLAVRDVLRSNYVPIDAATRPGPHKGGRELPAERP